MGFNSFHCGTHVHCQLLCILIWARQGACMKHRQLSLCFAIFIVFAILFLMRTCYLLFVCFFLAFTPPPLCCCLLTLCLHLPPSLQSWRLLLASDVYHVFIALEYMSLTRVVPIECKSLVKVVASDFRSLAAVVAFEYMPFVEFVVSKYKFMVGVAIPYANLWRWLMLSVVGLQLRLLFPSVDCGWKP